MRANIAFNNVHFQNRMSIDIKWEKKEYYTKIYNSGNLSQRRIFNFRR